MSTSQFNLARAGNVLAIVKESPAEEASREASELSLADLDDAGASYHAYGFYQEAEHCYGRVLEIKDRQGAHDEAYLNTLRRLAILYRLQRKYSDAEQAHLKAVALARSLFGSVHVKVAEQNNYLVGLYQTFGRSSDAVRVMEESRAMYAELEGPESANVGACHFALAMIQNKASKKMEAAKHFNQAQQIMSSHVFGPDETISNGLFGMAMYHYRQQDYENAETLFRHSIILREESLWPFHPIVPKTLIKLGVFYETQALNDKAELCYLTALEKQKSAFGEDHSTLLDALTRLASYYARKGDEAKAKACGQQILNLQDA